MHHSGSTPLPGKLLDLNLLPPRYRPRVIPVLGIGLGLLAAAGVLLLLAILQFKAAADADVSYLRGDLKQTQQRVLTLTQPAPTAEPHSDPFAQYRIGWARVLQTIVAAAPSDVRIQDVGFLSAQGAQAIIKGDAAEYAAVVEYADNLNSSPFFSKVSIRSISQITGTIPATIAPPPSPTASATQPTQGSIATPRPTTPALVPPQPTPTFVPPTPQLTLPSATPTPTAAGPISPTATATRVVVTPTIILASPTRGTVPAPATPIPAAAKDFVVTSRTESCDMSKPMQIEDNLVVGQVLDSDGKPLEGILVQVSSIDVNPYVASKRTDSAGNYAFTLKKAKWKAEVISGSSEVATDLWTRSDQEPGACYWTVNFKKASAGTPTPQPVAVPTITPTPSITPTPAATPTSTLVPSPTATAPGGTPVAGTPSATGNTGAAGLALDGDLTTAWNANAGPYQYWQQSFAGPIYVSGIALWINQNPAGATNHVVHFYSDQNFAVEIASTAVTFNGATHDGQMLSRVFANPIAGVQSMRVETTASPSNVAWYEIRVSTVPGPTATPTPTPTLSPTPTPRADANPIGVGETMSRVFLNPPNTYDWAPFVTTLLVSNVVTIRASGGAGTDPEINVYHSSRTGVWLGYNNDACGTTDALVTIPASNGVTYWAKITNRLGTAGGYTLTVRQGTLTCEGNITSAETVGKPGVTPTSGSLEPTAAATPSTPVSQTLPTVVASSGRAPGLAAPLIQPLDQNEGAPLRQAVSFVIVLDVKPGVAR